MSEKCTTRLAICAGLLLIISTIASGIWQPPIGQAKTASFIAHYLQIHWVANITYIITLFFSSIIIIPVIINTTILLFKVRPNSAIIAGSFFCMGIMLQIIATLGTLSRWIHAIPQSMNNNTTGVMLFETLNTSYVAINFPALLLIYSAAAVWVISFWNIHRMLATWLAICLLIIVAGIPSLFVARGSFLYFVLGSVMAYAMAYIYFGRVSSKISTEETGQNAA